MTWFGFFLELCGELAAGLVAARTPQPRGVAQTIEAARWKHRIVLVTAPTPSTSYPGYAEQKKLLTTAEAGLQERDVLVLFRPHGELGADDENYLRKRYNLTFKHLEVLLIGKDGGVKLHRTQPVTPAELFSLIDRMPMRREEMRR